MNRLLPDHRRIDWQGGEVRLPSSWLNPVTFHTTWCLPGEVSRTKLRWNPGRIPNPFERLIAVPIEVEIGVPNGSLCFLSSDCKRLLDRVHADIDIGARARLGREPSLETRDLRSLRPWRFSERLAGPAIPYEDRRVVARAQTAPGHIRAVRDLGVNAGSLLMRGPAWPGRRRRSRKVRIRVVAVD